jgi:hypothetical protein
MASPEPASARTEISLIPAAFVAVVQFLVIRSRILSCVPLREIFPAPVVTLRERWEREAVRLLCPPPTDIPA